ncbi:potassium channel family protein [Microbacterium sulfonylureivorans]|uniref:potassium channel family protein n=1 Tax=Microbacterium sulfonylureivorans TaxID=2486854 RepID=UPI00197B952B|nr:potassium channel family protein [Microbacterium sulfonylureivorans]
MTEPRIEPPIERLSRAQRRRVIVIGLLRALVAAVVLVTLYFVIPLQWIDALPVGLALIVAALVLAGVTVWQVLAIIRSADPGIRAIEALAVIAPVYLLLFAGAYFLMERNAPGTFSSALTRMDALYFTVTIFSTVGFGDISAVNQSARVLVTVQMILNLIVLGAGVRLLTIAVKHGREPKPAAVPPAKDS